MRRMIMLAVLLTITTAVPAPAQERSTAILVQVNPHRSLGMFTVPKSERVMTAPATAAPVSLEDASINSGGRRFGALSVITVKNSDRNRTVKRIEWRAAVYDQQRRTLHDAFHLSRDVSIKPGASKKTDSRLSESGSDDKDILPERAIVVIQLSAITFTDGTRWASAVECKPSEDLKSIECM